MDEKYIKIKQENKEYKVRILNEEEEEEEEEITTMRK